MINAAVFDMDGVIFDTERLYDYGWQLACQQLGYDLPESVRLSFVGLDAENSRRRLNEFSSSMDFDALIHIVLEYIRARTESGSIPIKPGLFELFDYLHFTGRRIALATSNAVRIARYQLEMAGLMKWFDAAVFGEDVVHGKPAPDIYALAVKRLGLTPGECIALEDSPAGIKSAFSAGLHPVMIPDMIPPSDELAPMLCAVKTDLSKVIPLIAEL